MSVVLRAVEPVDVVLVSEVINTGAPRVDARVVRIGVRAWRVVSRFVGSDIEVEAATGGRACVVRNLANAGVVVMEGSDAVVGPSSTGGASGVVIDVQDSATGHRDVTMVQVWYLVNVRVELVGDSLLEVLVHTSNATGRGCSAEQWLAESATVYQASLATSAAAVQRGRSRLLVGGFFRFVLGQ